MSDSRAVVAELLKHMGPGPHPSGSSQRAHGRRGKVQIIDYADEMVLVVGGVRAGQITWTVEQDRRVFTDDYKDALGDSNGYHREVKAFVIYPEFRRRGYGTLLFDRFVADSEATFGPKGWTPGKFTPEGAAFWRNYRGEDAKATERIVYRKHPGPDGSEIHATGSDQTIHGSGRAFHGSFRWEDVLASGFDPDIEPVHGRVWGNGVYLAGSFDDAEQWVRDGGVLTTILPDEVKPLVIRTDVGPSTIVRWYWESGKSMADRFWRGNPDALLEELLDGQESEDARAVIREALGTPELLKPTESGGNQPDLYRNANTRLQRAIESRGYNAVEIMPLRQESYNVPTGGHQLVIYDKDIIRSLRFEPALDPEFADFKVAASLTQRRWYLAVPGPVWKKLRAKIALRKHYGPVHPGTKTTQDPHGSWASGRGGTRDARSKPENQIPGQRTFDAKPEPLTDIVGRGKPHEWEGYTGFKERGDLSRDTVRRRINSLTKIAKERYGVPEDLQVKYWTDWDEWHRESGASGAMARYDPKTQSILLSPTVARGLFDENNPRDWRILTHELMHAGSDLGNNGLFGLDQYLEEGMSEIASLKLWTEEFDLGSFISRYTTFTRAQDPTGLKTMVSLSAYSPMTGALLLQAGTETGWDRDRMWEWMESKWRAGDSTTLDRYHNYGGLSPDENLAARLAETDTHYNRLIETTNFPEHIPGYRQEWEKAREYVREAHKGGDWKYDATQRWEQARSSAIKAGVNPDEFHQPMSDDTWEMQLLELKADQGQTEYPLDKDRFEAQEALAHATLYWFLKGYE